MSSDGQTSLIAPPTHGAQQDGMLATSPGALFWPRGGSVGTGADGIEEYGEYEFVVCPDAALRSATASVMRAFILQKVLMYRRGR